MPIHLNYDPQFKVGHLVNVCDCTGRITMMIERLEHQLDIYRFDKGAECATCSEEILGDKTLTPDQIRYIVWNAVISLIDPRYLDNHTPNDYQSWVNSLNKPFDITLRFGDLTTVANATLPFYKKDDFGKKFNRHNKLYMRIIDYSPNMAC